MVIFFISKIWMINNADFTNSLFTCKLDFLETMRKSVFTWTLVRARATAGLEGVQG